MQIFKINSEEVLACLRRYIGQTVEKDDPYVCENIYFAGDWSNFVRVLACVCVFAYVDCKRTKIAFAED